MSGKRVYGFGNPLLDMSVSVSNEDLAALGLDKGTMHLVDEKRQQAILDHLSENEMAYLPGGSCPNTIVMLSSLGVCASLAGGIGSDNLGHEYVARLAETGVADRLSRIADGATGTSVILVTPDGERTMCTHLGACQVFGPGHLCKEQISTADYLYFTAYMLDTPNQRAAVEQAVATARASGTRVVLDVADPSAVKRHADPIKHLLDESSIDVLFANREEALLLSGEPKPDIAAGVLCSRLPAATGIAVVKDGANGSVVAGSSVSESREPIPVAASEAAVIDTTGAGDSYAGAFLHALLEGYELTACARFAGFIAARVVEVRGAELEIGESARYACQAKELLFEQTVSR